MSAPTESSPDVLTDAGSRTDVLRNVAQRVLWLSTAIVDAANRGRPKASGIKVGGHQASSASMVDIMVSLWFAELAATDRVSVKPHASPVLHAINYLLGDLDPKYLTTLRAKGGLQSCSPISATLTASPWTGWCPTSRSNVCRECSPRPAGRSSP